VSDSQDGVDRDATQVTASSTSPGGELEPLVDEEPTESPESGHSDLARTALSQAQGLGRPPRARRRRSVSRGSSYSGPGPDERDPQRVDRVLEGLLSERGWARPVTQARIFADWAGLVGADVARHCEPLALRDGELRITAESTAWATQLRMMASKMLARLADELGAGVVTRLVITGPTGPSWKHGAWSVRGARGPRDTYG
jgi:predicted nucleic acid-binding Zn ribbon protein